MAESKGWAQALRRVTRGGADWTSSPGRGFSNMRDWAATMRKNLTQRAQRREEKSERVVGKFCSRWGAAILRPYRDYFLAALDLAAASAYFFWKRSTRPAV